MVDSGDHFFPSETLQPAQTPQHRLKARAIADGMKHIGDSVLCPGETDFSAGLSMFQELVQAAGATVVCSNLRRDGKRVFEATAVRTVAGLRIGFFGLLHLERPLPSDGLGAGTLTTSDPIEAAAEALHALRKDVDVVVALTHQGLTEDIRLAKAVAGIDIIVAGHSRESLPHGQRVGSTTIFQAGYQGRSIGLARIKHSPACGPTHADCISGELLELPGSVVEDATVSARLQKYETDLLVLNARKAPAPSAPPVAYWGAALCGQCHEKQDRWWKGTSHARAFETLVQRNKQADMDCLPCHTLGFFETRSRPENASVTDVSGLESVQCESCHAAGAQHNAPEIRLRASTQETCVACHDRKNSPHFDFSTWLGRVRCPAGN